MKSNINADKFIKELIKVEPLQLLGLCMAWGINPKDKTSEEIISEFIWRWSQLNRQERRQFSKFLRELNSEPKGSGEEVEKLLKQKLDQTQAQNLRESVNSNELSNLETSDNPNSPVGAESTPEGELN